MGKGENMSEISEEEYAKLIEKVSAKDLIRAYCDVFKVFITLIKEVGKIERNNPTAFNALRGSNKNPIPFFGKLTREVPIMRTGALFALTFRVASLGKRFMYMSAEEREETVKELESYVRVIEEEG